MLVAAALAATAAMGLSACAGSPSGPAAPSANTPTGAVWLDGGATIGLLTQGSSICAPVVAEAAGAGDALDVTLDPSPNDACTDDAVWRATLLATPAELDPTQDVSITVDGELEASVVLPALGADAPAREEYAPSAGWSTIPGALVVLSWGSSSCVPEADEVRAGEGGEAVVHFVEPPADRVCTMDMSPRATMVEVPGDLADATTAVLSGAEFDDVRVPILGS